MLIVSWIQRRLNITYWWMWILMNINHIVVMTSKSDIVILLTPPIVSGCYMTKYTSVLNLLLQLLITVTLPYKIVSIDIILLLLLLCPAALFFGWNQWRRHRSVGCQEKYMIFVCAWFFFTAAAALEISALNPNERPYPVANSWLRYWTKLWLSSPRINDEYSPVLRSFIRHKGRDQ